MPACKRTKTVCSRSSAVMMLQWQDLMLIQMQRKRTERWPGEGPRRYHFSQIKGRRRAESCPRTRPCLHPLTGITWQFPRVKLIYHTSYVLWRSGKPASRGDVEWLFFQIALARPCLSQQSGIDLLYTSFPH